MQLHSSANTLKWGAPLAQARVALILAHGRGGSAEDIAGLADVLPSEGIAFLAPSATGGAWYPNRFFVPVAQNEPWLSSALSVIGQLIREAEAAGVAPERVGLVGFSQGACLSLEYCARNPRNYAFVGGLSGGLIGPLDTVRAKADLKKTPILLGCADNDAHIPLENVEKSAEVLKAMNAAVTKVIFPGSAHRIFPQEIEWLKSELAGLGVKK